MRQWLVIISLAVMHCPDIATASPKSSDAPLWKKLLSSFTPKSEPARHAGVQPSRVATTSSAPKPAGGSEVHETTTSTGADDGCSGGHRVISAFYWQGEHTASGQPFDPKGMTAAHRTLKFGTRLIVTNPRTGKSVNVVVNDRGPFISGVSLDLSLGAAQAIGMHSTGAVCIIW
jgi:rare lipoprotein A